MNDDPIILEVRRIRHEMDQEAGYDYDKYIEILKENERKRLAVREKQKKYGEENNE